MATYSTGIVVAWNGVTFAQVQGLSWTFGGGPAKGRSVPWTDDCGSVTLTCLAGAGIDSSNYGVRGDLSISGGGAVLTTKAVYESVGVAYELNGVERYSVTFKILDG